MPHAPQSSVTQNLGPFFSNPGSSGAKLKVSGTIYYTFECKLAIKSKGAGVQTTDSVTARFTAFILGTSWKNRTCYLKVQTLLGLVTSYLTARLEL